MGLIKKFFGAGGAPAQSRPHSQFAESASPANEVKSRNGPRRELVQVVLRDIMRKHGIPSDWIDCRVLSVMTRQHKSGVHVQFIVRKGDDQLLEYVHAFQESFWEEIDKFDPHADQWLFSLAWQFEGKATRGFSAMPDPKSWADAGDTRPREAGDTLPPDDEDELATDLQALQALMSQPAGLVNLPDAKPRKHRGPGDA